MIIKEMTILVDQEGKSFEQVVRELLEWMQLEVESVDDDTLVRFHYHGILKRIRYNRDLDIRVQVDKYYDQHLDTLKRHEWEKSKGGQLSQRKKKGIPVESRDTRPQLHDQNYKPKGRKDYPNKPQMPEGTSTAW